MNILSKINKLLGKSILESSNTIVVNSSKEYRDAQYDLLCDLEDQLVSLGIKGRISQSTWLVFPKYYPIDIIYDAMEDIYGISTTQNKVRFYLDGPRLDVANYMKDVRPSSRFMYLSVSEFPTLYVVRFLQLYYPIK